MVFSIIVNIVVFFYWFCFVIVVVIVLPVFFVVDVVDVIVVHVVLFAFKFLQASHLTRASKMGSIRAGSKATWPCGGGEVTAPLSRVTVKRVSTIFRSFIE